MKTFACIAIGSVMIIASAAWSGDFAVYPGAKLDGELTEDLVQMQAGVPDGDKWNVAVYTTKDSYEKVCSFYTKIGKEYEMPSSPKVMKLPSGTDLKTQYFLFNGATDFQTATSWIKVQNPLISHKTVLITGPETKSRNIGEVPEITTIMHMKRK